MVTSTDSRTQVSELLTDAEELRAEVDAVVNSTAVMDVHTHLFPAEFKELCLWGIDDLLTYHYVTAETLRTARIPYAQFWSMSKKQQADLVWKTLFVDNTPTSEAAQGIISVLDVFGLDTRATNLEEARAFFSSRNIAEHLDHVFDIAQVTGVVMTNDPFDDAEDPLWSSGISVDPRFNSSLRLDHLVNTADVSTISQTRVLLDHWIQRRNPVYMALSLPPDFAFPSEDARDRLLRKVILPAAKEHRLALTLMIGVRRGVNPQLRDAGDSLGRADVSAIERLCSECPKVKF